MVLGKRFSLQVLFSLLYLTYSTVLEPQEVEPECFPVDWMGHVLRQRRGVIRFASCCFVLPVA